MKKVLCTIIVLFVGMLGIIGTVLAADSVKNKSASETLVINGYLDYYSGISVTIWCKPLMIAGKYNLDNLGTNIGEINSKTKITIAKHTGNADKTDITSLNGKRVTVNATYHIVTKDGRTIIICDKLHIAFIT